MRGVLRYKLDRNVTVADLLIMMFCIACALLVTGLSVAAVVATIWAAYTYIGTWLIDVVLGVGLLAVISARMLGL